MTQTIVLKVRAKHFKNRCYQSNNTCPLAAAAREQLKQKKIEEFVYGIKISNTEYEHAWYGHDKYLDDNKRAAELKFSDKIIRRVTLVKKPETQL